MNILVSDKWLREYVKMKQTPDEFAAAISLVGPAVERIAYAGADLDKVVVGKIVELGKHPNADKLRLAKTDVGGKVLTIVCGGSNLSEGQLVAVALVGARVRWHGQGELVTLEPATIRGVASEGMICASSEIGVADRFPAKDEKEIVDLSAFGYKPGMPLAKALGLNDCVYDIEVTSNRPDALGVVGLAREAAAATGGNFVWKEAKLPRTKNQEPNSASASLGKPISKNLKVSIQTKKTCSRYQAAVIEGITVGSSPVWMQERLNAAGLRPINAVVDITNYVMLELDQPMHAFDEAMVPDRIIKVREAVDGEKLLALDGKEYALKPGMMVIANAKEPIAIAGIMGGEGSGVTGATKNIVLEAACFDSASVRRTGRALNLRSDAAMRFEKNVPQGLTAPALARAVELVLALCGGKLVASADEIARRETAPRVSITTKALNEKIGIELAPAVVKKYLTALGFETIASASKITAKVPYWRIGDVAIAEDLVEEVARLYGYHKLPSIIPPGVSGEAPDPVFDIERRVRESLAGAGCADMMSVSLVGAELLKQSGEGETPVARIANPLTNDLEFLRPSHRARLLEAVRINEKNFNAGSGFEIGNVFTPAVHADELPVETLGLGIVVWGRSLSGGVGRDQGEIFYSAKGLLERMASALHINITFGKDFPKNDFWHPGRSVSVHLGDAVIGTLGELTPDARERAGVESRVALALVDVAELVKAAKPSADYREPSAYPPILRDIACIVPRKTEHEFIVAAVRAVDPLIVAIELFDHYEGNGIEEGKKNLAYHLTYQSTARTLVADEVDAIHAKVSRMLEHKFHAMIRE
jgi:phenylalanyl-tRNA synthetase beta chain